MYDKIDLDKIHRTHETPYTGGKIKQRVLERIELEKRFENWKPSVISQDDK